MISQDTVELYRSGNQFARRDCAREPWVPPLAYFLSRSARRLGPEGKFASIYRPKHCQQFGRAGKFLSLLQNDTGGEILPSPGCGRPVPG